MWDNPLNLTIFNWLGQFPAVSPRFNQIAHYAAGSHLLKGFLVMGALWYFWFRDADTKSNTRRILIATLIGAVVAVAIARSTNNLGPYQPRPFANTALPYISYAGLPERETQALFLWSSFPSDHATLFFALATGLFLISRRFGTFAFIYVLIVVALPRVYLGLHYPTDILAGAVLGIGSVLLFTRPRVMNLYNRPYTTFKNNYPAAFQTAFFLVSAEISMLFNDLRLLAEGIMKYLPGVLT
jgi:undecaprenyl-diphosphatase